MSSTPLRLRVTDRVEELPVLPTVLVELLGLDAHADNFPERVTELISIDPGFSLRVLVAANSAASAPIKPIVSVRAAIARIGSARAVNLVLAGGVAQAFTPRNDWERSLWIHALEVAVMAREIAAALPTLDVTPGTAYAAGLLHDIGRFVMFQEAPDELRDIDNGTWTDHRQLLDTELDICGIGHCLVGSLACKRWRLPEPLIEAIALHDDSASILDDTPPLVRIISAADICMFPSELPNQPTRADAPIDEFKATLPPLLPRGIDLDATVLRNRIGRSVVEAEMSARHLNLIKAA